jgi:hypothetical protein
VLVLAEWIGLQREATVTWTSLIGSAIINWLLAYFLIHDKGLLFMLELY